ncbi:MAG: transposase [Solobacterium sp.]|nr:transposase [Solobacterium sp.]
MFKEGHGIKEVYIACGYTDLRYGVDGLASLVQYQFSLDPFDEERSFCSAEERQTESKHFYGKETASCCFTRDWQTAGSGGRAQ